MDETTKNTTNTNATTGQSDMKKLRTPRKPFKVLSPAEYGILSVRDQEIYSAKLKIRTLNAERIAERKLSKGKKAEKRALRNDVLREEASVLSGVEREIRSYRKKGKEAKTQMNILKVISDIVNTESDV